MIKGGIGNLMKQAQLMQENLLKAKEKLAQLEVEGSAGAGMVQVVMTGKHDVKQVRLDPALLSEDKEMLEDLIAAAVNDAVRKVEAASEALMADMTAGMPLPPGMKLFF